MPTSSSRSSSTIRCASLSYRRFSFSRRTRGAHRAFLVVSAIAHAYRSAWAFPALMQDRTVLSCISPSHASQVLFYNGSDLFPSVTDFTRVIFVVSQYAERG